MSRKIMVLMVAVMSIMAGMVGAQVDSGTVTVSTHANGYLQFGQVARGTGTALVNGSYGVDDIWTESAHAGLSVEAAFRKHLTMAAGIEVNTYFSWPQEKDFFMTKSAYPEVTMGPTYGLYSSGETRLGDFEICAGYFDYKYNPDVRNLGEYMFRSGTYPAYIKTGFDYPMARLMGGRIGHSLFDKSFSHDIILSSETGFYPPMDWTLSYLFRYNVLNRNFIEIGGGISMAHLLSVYNNTYDQAGVKSPTNPVDQGISGNGYVTENGDTAYYTFRGDKLMARFSIDPKFLFGNGKRHFGESDLKVYVEALLIGAKSYPDSTLSAPQPSYSDWKEKTPVTFGINLPAFGIIDLLNLEFEWWGCKYYNDYRDIYLVNSLPNAPAHVDGIDKSYWKWSLYAKESLFDRHCALVCQVARDHMRLPSARYEKANHREMLVQAGDWWWVTKLCFAF